MSATPNLPILLLGLKGTGKTHFLVALDWILDRQTDPEGLKHADLANDRSYLQPLRESWLRGEEFERTSRTNPPPPHHLIAKHEPTKSTINFHLPDLAGETFDSHFVTRSFPLKLCERLQQVSGILLFVHCDSNSDHAILDHPALMGEQDGEKTKNPKAAIASPWKLEDAALQVKLVDLLQFIAEVRRSLPPARIAILVSAWELIERLPAAVRKELPGNPAAFINRNWPLLAQYLRANAEKFDSRIFGVSARGGGASPAEIKRLIQFDNPTDRVLLIDDDHQSSDLSRPIRWLLKLFNSDGQSNG